jgi:predicted aspartyl protease
MAPSRRRHELLVDTHLCTETVLPGNLMNELPYSQLQDRTFGSVQQARVVSTGVHCRGNTVT